MSRQDVPKGQRTRIGDWWKENRKALNKKYKKLTSQEKDELMEKLEAKREKRKAFVPSRANPKAMARKSANSISDVRKQVSIFDGCYQIDDLLTLRGSSLPTV